MIENVSTQLTVFHCLCPLPALRKGLSLPLRSAPLEKEAEIGGRAQYFYFLVKSLSLIAIKTGQDGELAG